MRLTSQTCLLSSRVVFAESWFRLTFYRQTLLFSAQIPRGLYFSKALFEGLIFGWAYIPRGDLTEGFLRYL